MISLCCPTYSEQCGKCKTDDVKILYTTRAIKHRRPPPAPHCRMLPLVTFNSMVPIPLPIYLESFKTIYGTIFSYCCNFNKHYNKHRQPKRNLVTILSYCYSNNKHYNKHRQPKTNLAGCHRATFIII